MLELDGRQVHCIFDCVLLTMGYAIMIIIYHKRNENTDKVKINMLKQ